MLVGLSNHSVGCLFALLNQRHAHYLTRFAVETAVLHEQSANVLSEAELLEEWLTASVQLTSGNWRHEVKDETTAFDEFLTPLRDQLKEPSRRAGVRRAVHAEIERRFRA